MGFRVPALLVMAEDATARYAYREALDAFTVALELLLDAGTALVVGEDEAEHVRRQIALGVEPGVFAPHRDAGQLRQGCARR